MSSSHTKPVQQGQRVYITKTWRQIDLPPVSGSPSVIDQGYSTWDASQLSDGVVSVMWHREADNIGDPTPIDAYTFTLSEDPAE